MHDTGEIRDVNILKPHTPKLKSEVFEIFAILLGWAGLTFGFQLLLRLLGPGSGESILTRLTFFGLPFHFWFTGQFLPLWFIILCVLFNLYIDFLSRKNAGRRDNHAF